MYALRKSKHAKTALAHIGIPILIIAYIILHSPELHTTLLLRHSLLIAFGYVAAVSDIKSKTISNSLILLMLITWAVFSAPSLLLDPHACLPILIDSALGFFVIGAISLIVYYISRKGLGGGDVKFLSAAALYLGLNASLASTLIGTLLAALTALMLILMKKINRKDSIPLAPFLYIGILFVLFI